MARLTWTRQAITDLYEISERLPAARAAVLVDEVFARTAHLEQYPRMGRMVPEFENPALRELIFRDLRILYRIKTEAQVHILTIHRGPRPLATAPPG